jgi:serine/threonine protein kinase
MKYCTVCKAKYEDSVSFCPVDGEVLEDDPSSIVDTVLDGQYQIESMLGKGGMGAVYLARHILLGDRVAIKILPAEVRNNAEWLRRFRREGQAARRFRHPNSVTVYDLRTASDGTIYMVMEYVEGRTLDAELKRRGRVTPAEAFEILEPIMSVLNTAHSMGVVHRDLKPENIMIGTSGNGGEPLVKLLDLGIAKMREIAGSDTGGTTALTMAGQVLGTPYYMSPEQWGEIPRDGNPEIDGRADIYSLGLVFYEMIVGRRPCSGKTLSELRREHVSVTPKPLHEVMPDVSEAFSSAIVRAIAKDRDDRQATAGELAAELRNAIGMTPAVNLSRTLPDLPHIESSSAHTAEIPPSSNTKSDVDAPTILTIDSEVTTGPSIAVPTSAPRVEVPPRQVPSPAPAPAQRALENSVPAVYEPSNLDSSVTIQQPPRVPPLQPVAEPAKKGSSIVFVGIGVLALVLLVVGVGGFLAYKFLSGKSDSKSNTAANTKGTETTSGVALKDLGRYWLEILPTRGEENVRIVETKPLSSGQPFKFHFQLADDGYIYVIGPDNENRPTAFLTAKPASVSGVTTNRVTKSEDFSFPSGLEHWLELNKKPGTENYTIIYSPTPLSTPAFFNEQVTGEPLTKTQQAEFEDFLAKYDSTKPKTELNDANKSEPFVQLKVPTANTPGRPTIFQISIEHR